MNQNFLSAVRIQSWFNRLTCSIAQHWSRYICKYFNKRKELFYLSILGFKYKCFVMNLFGIECKSIVWLSGRATLGRPLLQTRPLVLHVNSVQLSLVSMVTLVRLEVVIEHSILNLP